MRPVPLRSALGCALLASVVALAAAAASAAPPPQPPPEDTRAIGSGDRSPATVTAALAEEAAPGRVDHVLIARDDTFADALASGVLQGAAVLLLVPREGPLPAPVSDVIGRLGATRATVLGGTAAVSPAVEQQITGLGLAVDRLAGVDRAATAAAIAQAAGGAGTAILVRGYAGTGTDVAGGFADSLAAGALAARRGWPVLLTAPEGLPAATAAYLEAAPLHHVVIVGGRDAVSSAVLGDVAALGLTVERVAGADRFATAVAVARSSPGGGHAVVVDGVSEDAWAGGFAAAALSRAWDAPLLLAAPDRLPLATRAFLAEEVARPADTDRVLSCVLLFAACEAARTALGLPPAVRISADPPAHTWLERGQPIAVTIGDGGDGLAHLGGDCAPATTTAYAPGVPVRLTAAPPPLPQPCSLTVTVTLPGGTRQTARFPYNSRRSVTLAATGDLLIHQAVTSRARRPDGALDFAGLLADAAPVIGAADMGLCHLEVPLTADHSRLSGYPRFNAPAEVADGITATGWDLCSTASNHTLDQGFGGIVETLGILDSRGIAHTGAARTPEEAGPMLHDLAGTTMGVVSATYGTNGIPLPAERPWAVTLLDPEALIAQAREAREAGADVVVLSLHWGAEYGHAPTLAQAAAAEEITASGLVDLIVGHHAHVVQPVARVNGVPVAYGLGNFLSGQFQTPDRSDGVILRVRFREVGGGRWAADVGWTPTRVDPQTYRVRVLDDPQTAADRAAAERTHGHMGAAGEQPTVTW